MTITADRHRAGSSSAATKVATKVTAVAGTATPAAMPRLRVEAGRNVAAVARPALLRRHRVTATTTTAAVVAGTTTVARAIAAAGLATPAATLRPPAAAGVTATETDAGTRLWRFG
jgi:hypothetical protein